MTELAKSPYVYLFDDENFKRWYENVKRGSTNTAFEWFRRMGMIHKRFNVLPKDIARMNQKRASAFLLDMVTALEKEGKSGSYISNNVKPVKNWLSFNGIQVNQRIKISRRNELVTVADEKVPSQEEANKIFSFGSPRAKAAAGLIALSGLRPESLGDAEGNDGLVMDDIPEMVIDQSGAVQFARIPAMITVRANLSKAGHQYFTFAPAEECEYLKQYIEYRIRRGEKITAKAAVITQDWWKGNEGWKDQSSRGPNGHLRTVNLSDAIRRPIRRAGFKWRPYVLRRYFDTRMMVAEMDGLIIRDFRVFWMGHTGDIEHTYTLNKKLPEDVVEKMRFAFRKASDKHLVTWNKSGSNIDQLKSQMNRQFLKVAGYSDEEIEAKELDLATLTSDDIDKLGREKQKQKLDANRNNQKVVAAEEVEKWLLEGWEFCAVLPNNRAIIKMPR
ncbi:MAG: site-specific integrase [Nitrososphaera sp.]